MDQRHQADMPEDNCRSHDVIDPRGSSIHCLVDMLAVSAMATMRVEPSHTLPDDGPYKQEAQ
jgi:hypothetical protein